MSVTIVNDYYFKPGGDVAEGKAAAADLVNYFLHEVPEVEISLWLEGQENPLHHYHITVFISGDVVQKVRDSAAIKQFVDRLYPHIDHSSFISPACDVWLADGSGVQTVNQR